MWSKIGKTTDEDKIETTDDKNQKKCIFCTYTCKKRITMMKHTKHGHGHGEPESFSKVDQK